MKYSDNAMITLVEFENFISFTKKHLSDEERNELIAFLAVNPKKGEIIEGTGGLRKLRWGAKGKGKSGGVRIIYYYYSEQMPLLLLTGFPKNEMENISQEAKNAFKKLVPKLVQDYLSRGKK